MPRKGGQTPQSNRRKHAGHRVHRKGRLARKAAKAAQRRSAPGWDHSSRWDDELGKWV